MKVLIYEPNHFGHRFEFVGHLVRELLNLTDHVILATTKAAVESLEYKSFIAPSKRLLSHVMLDPVDYRSSWRHLWQRVLQLERILLEVKPDHAFVPDASGLSQMMNVRVRSRPNRDRDAILANTEALLMSGQLGYPGRKRRLSSWLSELAVANHPWQTAFHLDPYQVAYMNRRGHGRLELLPDPVSRAAPISKAEARKRLNLPVEGGFIGCLGGIEKSKGCDLLIEAFAEAKAHLPPDARLLLAGKFQDGIFEWLQKEFSALVGSNQIIAIDRFLSCNEINWAMQALDVVCLPYHKAFQSSGIFLRAVAESKVILANQSGWMAQTVRDIGTGHLCDINNANAFSSAIVESYFNGSFRQSERVERFVEFHSVENYCSTWMRTLLRKMGRDPSRLLTWDWVLAGDLAPTDFQLSDSQVNA